MNQKHYIGNRVTSMELYDEIGPVTGVALIVDDENEIFAGDESGYVLEMPCPYATYAMANSMLAKAKGRTYKGYSAENAPLGIGAELGDGVTVGRVYSMLAYQKLSFGPGHLSAIAAPGEKEVDHEFPYQSPLKREVRRNKAQAYSCISKTAEEIRAEVSSTKTTIENGITETLKSYSTTQQTAEAISTKVSKELESYSTTEQITETLKSYSTIQQTMDAISTKVSEELESYSTTEQITETLKSYSTIQQTTDAISTKVSEELESYSTTEQITETLKSYSTIQQTSESISAAIKGFIDGDDAETLINAALGKIELSVSSADGTSIFKIISNGVAIATSTLDLTVDAANISGNVNLGGLLAVYEGLDSQYVGGYLGYDDGYASATGIGIRSYKNGNGPQVVCTDEAARISYTAYAGGNIAYQTGVICGSSTLTLDAYQLIQIRLGRNLTALFDIDEDGIYPLAAATLGTASYEWEDVFAAGTSMSDLLRRVNDLENA